MNGNKVEMNGNFRIVTRRRLIDELMMHVVGGNATATKVEDEGNRW